MPFTTEIKKEIFEAVKSVLQKQSPPMVISKNTADCFELTGNKPVPYGSKKTMIPGMYFSSVVARENMISFYFFPMYYHEDDFKNLIPTMIKTLKGKTCFNIKKPQHVNEKELSALLAKGVQAWKKNGYIQ